MKLLIVVALCTVYVVGDRLTLIQFSKEVLEIAVLNNYDAVFVDLDQTLLDLLSRKITLPKSIFSCSSCAPVSKKRLLYFTELSGNSSKTTFTLSCYPQGIVLLFYRNSSTALEIVRQTTILLRKLQISKAIYVVYDPATLHITFITYDFLGLDPCPINPSEAISNFFTPTTSTDLHGYRYRVNYKPLYPYFNTRIVNGTPKLLGLDFQLTQTIAISQNATIQFDHDPKDRKRCPVIDSSADINIRRTACTLSSTDRLYLPQWDDVCVVFPKRHQRLILLQFTKPFQLEVWILTAIFIVVRFFCQFDRWRLLLLAVVLMEFWLTESYEVKVIQYMTTLRYAPNPKTMAELIARREQFIVGAPEIDFLQAYSGVDVEVVDVAKEIYVGQRAMFYFCRTAEAVVNSEHNYNPKTNDRTMTLLKERLRPSPSSYGFVRNHPLRDGFERYLRHVFESGVWRKIHDQFIRQDEQFAPLLKPGEYLIEFGDLMPLWIFCGIGWIVAFVVFVLEKIWKKIV